MSNKQFKSSSVIILISTLNLSNLLVQIVGWKSLYYFILNLHHKTDHNQHIWKTSVPWLKDQVSNKLQGKEDHIDLLQPFSAESHFWSWHKSKVPASITNLGATVSKPLRCIYFYWLQHVCSIVSTQSV